MSDSNPTRARAYAPRFRRARKLAPLLRVPRWREGLRHGVAATVEHRDVPFAPDYETVLDVGGHHGQFTLFALESFPLAKVICIEPQAEGIAKLRELFHDEPRVEELPFGLSDEPGQVELHISQKSDSSSLLPIGSHQVDAHPGTAMLTTETIEVRTLDSLLTDAIARPSLLKIDVQGSELAVLKGATQTLQQIDEVFVECSFVELYEGQALADEVIALLISEGFRLRGVYSMAQDVEGECLQADFYFTRR